MDDERMDNLLGQGPPPLPGRLVWTPDTTTLSARCPICGETCDSVYIDQDGLTVGCNHCITVAYIHDFAIRKGRGVI